MESCQSFGWVQQQPEARRRSKSLPDGSQLEKMTRLFVSGLSLTAAASAVGRSCSLQDAHALREAYSSSECDSTSSSSSSSESLSTTSSSSSSDSDSDSDDDDDDFEDDDGVGNLGVLPPRKSATTGTTTTTTTTTISTATGMVWRPLSALQEEEQLESAPSSPSSSVSAEFAASSASEDVGSTQDCMAAHESTPQVLA